MRKNAPCVCITIIQKFLVPDQYFKQKKRNYEHVQTINIFVWTYMPIWHV